MAKNLFPAKDGWIRMTLTMSRPTPLSEAEIKSIATFGGETEHEFGPIRQYGRKVTVICRHQSRAPKTEGAAMPGGRG